ncbi:hypothetical protein H206_02997 [Candidatus Electrothrix aarhusensis]|uniref:Uncharacterized protein n=1 Tax=Candidatus Electrothrix aarhusensis TaxID=1859131 RepID=A0A3S3QNP7_9BACT|nr:hypothetical protein H206_02997 [Candidatus Electrothrix aarhusensis]
MNKYRKLFLLTIMLVASSGIGIQNSTAALGPDPMPNVEGLTVEEAEKNMALNLDTTIQ